MGFIFIVLVFFLVDDNIVLTKVISELWEYSNIYCNKVQQGNKLKQLCVQTAYKEANKLTRSSEAVYFEGNCDGCEKR